MIVILTFIVCAIAVIILFITKPVLIVFQGAEKIFGSVKFLRT